jgi:spore coat protein H
MMIQAFFAVALGFLPTAKADSLEFQKKHSLVIYTDAENFKNFKRFKSHPWLRNKFVDLKQSEVSINGADRTKAKVDFRGQSCSEADRPCLEIESKTQLQVNKKLKSKEFNLNSLAGDKGYINNKIGFGMAKAFGLITFPTEYIQVTLQDFAQTDSLELGLYLIMQKPVQFLKGQLDADYVARKRYQYIDSRFVNPELKMDKKQIQKFLDDLYESAEEETIKGTELVSALKETMDLDQYLDWLALNSVVKNGDYADEVFFFANLKANSKPYFKILAWDFDDLFGSIHSIPFYTRSCDDYEYAPVHNCESPLDRAIIKDPVAYMYLLNRFKKSISNIVNDQLIENLEKQIWSELYFYLIDPKIVEAAKRDRRSLSYDPNSILKLLKSRMLQIQNRKAELLKQIDSEISRLQN